MSSIDKNIGIYYKGLMPEGLSYPIYDLAAETVILPPDFMLKIENYVGIPSADLEAYEFSDYLDTAKNLTHIRSPEALIHGETQTLIVPPPSGSGRELTPEDLALMAVPAGAFINETQPDMVVGCDRGGRLYSLAVYSLWNNFYISDRFPTLDSRLHFARLSTSTSRDAMDRSLRRIVEQSTVQADVTGKNINGSRPRVLFIDDWVLSGTTRAHILASLNRLGLSDDLDINFAVMCGGNADASGSDVDVEVSWHDDPDTIGVDYGKNAMIAHPIRTSDAHGIRRAIHWATREVASQIR